MKIVSVVGRKNTGKTSLTVKIIEELTRRGYNVVSIKHSHHEMEMDREHTDTWRHKLGRIKCCCGNRLFYIIFNVRDIFRTKQITVFN